MTTKRNTTHGLRIQARDRAILASLSRFRLLTSEHLRLLHFPDRTLRAVQHRLTRLFSHRLIVRCHLPRQLGATSPERTGPVYALGSAGSRLLADDGQHHLHHGLPWRGVGPAALLHHLTVVDLFVSLTVALAGRADVSLTVEPELAFRHRLQTVQRSGGVARPFIIPDGAVTLTTDRATTTFYIEVMRADVKGGTRRFRERLERYALLHHAGVLRSLYGHERLRAVLWIAASPRRAETLRQAAQPLKHGRQLFWFGNYAERDAGHSLRTLTPTRVLEPRFTTVDGESVSLSS